MAPALTPDRVAAVLARHPAAPCYWIGFSGGLDSAVLLHLCRAVAQTGTGRRFAALHVHHGLQSSADNWAAHAQACCAALGIPLRILHVDARPKPGESPEAAARTARYTAFQAVIGSDDVLLTGQHQDDQAETVMLQLLRGAGPTGLAAMPEWAPFGCGFLGRPLLDLPRSALRDYAVRHRLDWLEDPSNSDPRFDRNFLRHRILPAMQARWPGLAKTLSRGARLSAEAAQLLSELGDDLLSAVRSPSTNSLSTLVLAELSPPRQRLVLRRWLQTSGIRPPAETVIERIRLEALAARPDRHPIVSWSEVSVRRHRGELYLLRATQPFDSALSSSWPGVDSLVLPDGNGMLTAEFAVGAGIDGHRWGSASIEVKYRQGGERFQPAGHGVTRELKKLLQASGAPPWIRERIPLIYMDGELAVIAGLWVSAAVAGRSDTINCHVRWKQPELTVTPTIGP